MADIELVIKIPEKEFGIDINDKFQDFFSRLKAEIKEHLITNTSLICGAYELETIDMFLEAFKNGTPLPKGHGDLVDRDMCLEMKCRDLVDADGVTMYAVPTGNILRMDAVIPADKE